MRVLAIIATYNEERFIGGCIEHLESHGVDVYVCDNYSDDATRATLRACSGGCAMTRGSARDSAAPRDRLARHGTGAAGRAPTTRCSARCSVIRRVSWTHRRS